jgi:hypothetical protein
MMGFHLTMLIGYLVEVRLKFKLSPIITWATLVDVDIKPHDFYGPCKGPNSLHNIMIVLK